MDTLLTFNQHWMHNFAAPRKRTNFIKKVVIGWYKSFHHNIELFKVALCKERFEGLKVSKLFDFFQVVPYVFLIDNTNIVSQMLYCIRLSDQFIENEIVCLEVDGKLED